MNSSFCWIPCCVFTLLIALVALNRVFAQEPAQVDVSSNLEQGKAGERRTIKMFGIESPFRYCPAGTYTIGSPENEEGREDDEIQHKVILSQPYWTMETEVTQKLWRAVMRSNPSEHKGDDLPVEKVSWDDCQKFIKKLNAKGFAPKGWVFSLPTEAEWEIAARAGSQTAFPWGDAWDKSKANDGVETTKVGSFPPNAWGLLDMSGNVYEWCLDAYEDYPANVESDRLIKDGERRVFRGGSWGARIRALRSACRFCCYPTDCGNDLGFRCVLVCAQTRQ